MTPEFTCNAAHTEQYLQTMVGPLRQVRRLVMPRGADALNVRQRGGAGLGVTVARW